MEYNVGAGCIHMDQLGTSEEFFRPTWLILIYGGQSPPLRTSSAIYLCSLQFIHETALRTKAEATQYKKRTPASTVVTDRQAP